MFERKANSEMKVDNYKQNKTRKVHGKERDKYKKRERQK